MACQTSQAFLRVEELGLAEQYLAESADVSSCGASEASNDIDQTIVGCTKHSSTEGFHRILDRLPRNQDHASTPDSGWRLGFIDSLR